jgi:hypothetical protein
MIKISLGGMCGRIGNIIWYNGSDMLPDDYYNTIESGGWNRFGSIQWLPLDLESQNIVLRFMGLL